jgi:large subunit ribosomal protein L9
MQVILLEKVQKLGNLGDEVSVKAGYGRNFLVPAGKALPANKNNREKFEARRAELEAAAAKLLTAAQEREKKLVAAGEVDIMANAGVEGKLFGSVTAAEIADAVNAKGADVDRNEVRLPTGPLRHTGEYNIDVLLLKKLVKHVMLHVKKQKRLPKSKSSKN